jgi:hypothetical protein
MIAKRSNCYDLCVLLVEEGLFVEGQLKRRGREIRRWMELLEMYGHLLDEDSIKGVLMKTLPEGMRVLLASVLDKKDKGKLVIARDAIEEFEGKMQ